MGLRSNSPSRKDEGKRSLLHSFDSEHNNSTVTTTANGSPGVPLNGNGSLTRPSEDKRANYQSCDTHDLNHLAGVAAGNGLRKKPSRIRLTSMELHHTVTLSWEGVSVYVEEKKRKKGKEKGVPGEEDGGEELKDVAAMEPTQGKDGRKQILKDVFGIVEPGTLLAVMGASGAGKSTLMNVLTNRNTRDYEQEGMVKINGVPVHKDMSNISAYVQQDDIFLSTLTVRETLTFRALLRMDNSIHNTARMQRVEEVMQEMGLMKCSETQVGMSGKKKGISGGEAKRLSFACEMLTNPPLLFCDEPTSGLDTFMAQNIVQTLRHMARKNRTILCTIHQPSSEIFALFDRVLLIAEGRVAFLGSSEKAMEFFRDLKYNCPSNFNPADFFVLTLAIVPGNEKYCRDKVHAICDSFNESLEADEIRQKLEDVSIKTKDEIDAIKEMIGGDSRYEASWSRQFSTLLWRSWISVIRDVNLFRVRIIQTLTVALILGLMYLQLDYDQKGVMNINGAIFLLITSASFSNVFAVINSFPHELAIFLREYGSGLYRTDVYYLAKNLAELPTFIILPFIQMSIDYWMVGLYPTWQAYLIASCIIVLVSNVAMSFGMLLSTVTGDVNLGLAITPPMMIPLLMFGGFFLNTASVPIYFIWLEYLSWFKYAFELMTVNQWEDVTYVACEKNDTIACQYNTGHDVLEYISFSSDSTPLNVGLLFVLYVVFKGSAFIFLYLKARRSGA